MNTETDIVKEMRWLLSAQTKETNGPHYYTVPRRKMNAILNEIERLRGAPPRPSTAEKTLKNTLESTAMCIDKQHTFEDGETQFARTWWFETEAARDAAALASPSTEGWREAIEAAARIVEDHYWDGCNPAHGTFLAKTIRALSPEPKASTS